jgi:hypothetical protein
MTKKPWWDVVIKIIIAVAGILSGIAGAQTFS